MKKFAEKVAFVTGAASGIGRATAIKLAEEGATLTIADINEEMLEETANSCREFGAVVLSLKLDVSDFQACSDAINACIETHEKLDILCNIAGIHQAKHLADITIEDWQHMVAINQSSVFYLCQLAMPHLIETKGNIVNIASSAGLVGQAYHSTYCATKAAVLNFTKALAVEFSSKSVRANAICPGFVKTALTQNFQMPDQADPMHLFRCSPLVSTSGAEPEEVAAMIAYVASDDASFVTGAALSIDGGQVAC